VSRTKSRSKAAGGASALHLRGVPQGLKRPRKNWSFAPPGLALVPHPNPQLALWAAFLRRFAAKIRGGTPPEFLTVSSQADSKTLVLFGFGRHD
jgi:hypothetical protein